MPDGQKFLTAGQDGLVKVSPIDCAVNRALVSLMGCQHAAGCCRSVLVAAREVAPCSWQRLGLNEENEHREQNALV